MTSDFYWFDHESKHIEAEITETTTQGYISQKTIVCVYVCVPPVTQASD